MVRPDCSKEFSDQLSTWLDDSLTSMGDIYKRKLQTHSFFVGLAIAVGMNIDTILVTHQLYHSEPLRSFLASIGEDYSRNETTRICSDRR